MKNITQSFAMAPHVRPPCFKVESAAFHRMQWEPKRRFISQSTARECRDP